MLGGRRGARAAALQPRAAAAPARRAGELRGLRALPAREPAERDAPRSGRPRMEAYQRAVEADPSYAPAWARFGRCLRVVSKYGSAPEAQEWLDQAEEALQRAFRINPDLSLAHHLYTHFEVDAGRSLEAMVRLLGRVRGCSSDPELYAGLVHACRYVGLLDASIAAYRRATRLDPGDSHQHRPFVLHERRLRTGDRARRRRPRVPHRRSRCMHSDDRTRRWTCADWRASGVRPTSSSSC